MPQAAAYRYDVAIVGASLAGSAAAVLFARAGLKVALIERASDISSYKHLCTHYIQPSAVPTLVRLGLMSQLESAGARVVGMDFRSRWGWIRHPEDCGGWKTLGINLRREKLDPLIRRLAAETPGVDLMLGRTVRALLRDGAKFNGVVTEARDGSQEQLGASLVVGADGRDSTVASLASCPEKVSPHRRFMYYAYYRDVELPSGAGSKVWILDPDIAYAFPTDDGLTLLACALSNDKLPAFKGDIEGSFTRFMQGLPDGPRFLESQRVSEFSGSLAYRNVYRGVTQPGLALIGDAALVADYIWGVGCGWALQSAEWLADATAAELVLSGACEEGLQRYRKKHLSALRGHFFMICDFARGRRLNPLEKLLLSAATKDAATAEHFASYSARQIGLLQFLSPRALGRALVTNLVG